MHSKPTYILTFSDILHYLRHPLFVLLFGAIASWLAFNTGIDYARHHVQVNSITHHLAFIEIAGEEHLYELDWWEETPIYWNH